jgi:hypothetical protein
LVKTGVSDKYSKIKKDEEPHMNSELYMLIKKSISVPLKHDKQAPDAPEDG